MKTEVGGMKRVIVRGIICVLMALFSVYGNPLMIYPEDVKNILP